MDERCVGVLGATSPVGSCLLPLLDAAERKVVAFTRRTDVATVAVSRSVEWRSLTVGETGARTEATVERLIPNWVCLAPMWVLPDCFEMLERFGVERVVALSSTSLYTKETSTDPAERALARKLADGETRVVDWARASGIEAIILRSTLIYGLGWDKNISTVARFIRRFGFFPLLSAAQGLRQPVHAADVAAACAAALQQPHVRQSVYNLSGGETLTYREMVARVFAALHKPVRFVQIPEWIFRLALAGLRMLPRFRHWSPQMAQRMNVNLVFNHSDAARDLAFAPRGFVLSSEDLPAR